MLKRARQPNQSRGRTPARRTLLAKRPGAPFPPSVLLAVGGLDGLPERCADFSDFPEFSECGDPSFFIRQLCDQFAAAVADEKLEASLSMLAGCPRLALLPCHKALFSALHWSCISVRMAPLTRALLRLGADPYGGTYPAKAGSAASTPIRWAAGYGNVEALGALLEAGALPELGDLLEACRAAQGACALEILGARPDLDPFCPAGQDGASCHQALIASSRPMRLALVDERLRITEALAAFDKISLARVCPTVAASSDRGRL